MKKIYNDRNIKVSDIKKQGEANAFPCYYL